MVDIKQLTGQIRNHAEEIKWRQTHLTFLHNDKPEKTSFLELEDMFNGWLLKFNETVKGME